MPLTKTYHVINVVSNQLYQLAETALNIKLCNHHLDKDSLDQLEKLRKVLIIAEAEANELKDKINKQIELRNADLRA